jgi:hypothetical protein
MAGRESSGFRPNATATELSMARRRETCYSTHDSSEEGQADADT